MIKGLVFETDPRIRYAGDELEKRGCDLTRIRNQSDAAAITEAEDLSFVILPIRGTADGTVMLDGEAVSFDHLLRHLPPEALVVAGITTEYEMSLNCRFLNFQDDPETVAKNAEYTAEGLLFLLLSNTPESIFSYTYDLLGDGNTGRAIHALFQKLGLSHHMVTREGGEDRERLDVWQTRRPSGVIVNTIPVEVIPGRWFEDQSAENELIYVFDISSGGRGMRQEDKNLPGVRYMNAPPLPGLAAPKSAGLLLADLVINKLPVQFRIMNKRGEEQ